MSLNAIDKITMMYWRKVIFFGVVAFILGCFFLNGSILACVIIGYFLLAAHYKKIEENNKILKEIIRQTDWMDKRVKSLLNEIEEYNENLKDFICKSERHHTETSSHIWRNDKDLEYLKDLIKDYRERSQKS